MVRVGLARAGRLAGLLVALTICAYAAEKFAWKQVDGALLRIDDRAPKLWNLYHTGKKFDPLLLQLGTRFLAIYIRNQAVYEVPPAQVERKSDDLLWRESDKPEKPIATSDWSTRDVGSAVRTRFKLADEGRMLDVQIPQMPDLRGVY